MSWEPDIMTEILRGFRTSIFPTQIIGWDISQAPHNPFHALSCLLFTVIQSSNIYMYMALYI